MDFLRWEILVQWMTGLVPRPPPQFMLGGPVTDQCISWWLMLKITLKQVSHNASCLSLSQVSLCTKPVASRSIRMVTVLSIFYSIVILSVCLSARYKSHSSSSFLSCRYISTIGRAVLKKGKLSWGSRSMWNQENPYLLTLLKIQIFVHS